MAHLKRIADGFTDQILIAAPPATLQDLTVLPLTERLYLTIAGYFPHATYHYRERPRGCGDLILIYCTQGEGWCRLEQRALNIPAGHFILIPAHQSHSYGATEADPWSIYWAHFQGSAGAIYQGHFPSTRPIAKCSDGMMPQIEKLFTSMLDHLQQDFSLNAFVHASAILNHILSLLFLRNPSLCGEIKETHAESVERSIQYMRLHLHEGLSLTQLAQQAGLSVPHFSRLFRQKTGAAPMEYFIKLKIQRACQFLMTSSSSVQQIALQLGYQDPYYFSRLFSKVMGISPNHYRKAHQ